MKKITKALLAVIMILSTLLVITACSTVDKISIKTAPQTTYIVGQELDLSLGELTAVSGDTQQTVKMTDSEVSVSGYNKNQKGEQTLTVTYKNQSTTLAVKVVDRIVAENYRKDYFVGDEFDTSAGRIRITRDDGSSYAIAINSEKLTFGDITATETGESSVTVRYYNTPTDYSGTIPIIIHPVDEMKFVKPIKISYYSHDEGVDLSGGYITLVGNDGKLEKDVPLTKATVSGLDLTKATKENKEITQEINVVYGGETFKYDVKVTYTDVNEIKKNAQSMMDLDWDGSVDPTYTKAQGDLAIETLNMYVGLNDSHKSLISEEELLAFTRLAFSYSFDSLFNVAEKYSGTFVISYQSVDFVCTDKSIVMRDVNELKNENNPFYTYMSAIETLVKQVPDKTVGIRNAEKVMEFIYGEDSGANEEFDDVYISILEGTVFNDVPYIGVDVFKTRVFALIEFIVNLSNKIPDVATVENVAQYKSQLTDAVNYIIENQYTEPELYDIASGWRTENDLADLLFAHLYNGGTPDDEKMQKLAIVMLPKKVQELYNNVLLGIEYANYINANFNESLQKGGMIMHDASNFFAIYYDSLSTKEEFIAGEYGNMNKYFFENVSISAWVSGDTQIKYTCSNLVEEIKYMNGGYLTTLGSNINNEKAEIVLKKYVTIFSKLQKQSNYANSTEYKTAVEDLFNSFVDLSPAEQSGILYTLNSYYEYGLPEIAFDQITEREMLETGFGDTLENVIKQLGIEATPEELFGNTLDNTFFVTEFARIIVEHYKGYFSTINLDKTFHSLLRVIESYTFIGARELGNETFADYLDQLNTAFNALSPDEKEEFNAKVGTIYEKYKNLALIHQDGYVATDLGDWADEFSALEKACQTATEAYISAANYNVALSSLYIAYERANNIVNHIMKNAPSNVLYAFNYEPVLKYNVTQYDEDGNSETVTYNYTADLYFSNVRYYYNAMTSYVELHGYISADMSAFFDTAYDVTFGSLYLEGGQVTQSDVLAVMSAFDALTLEDKDLFYFLDLSWSKKGPFYFYMLAEYFTDTMTENASKVAIELLVELEVTYVYAAYYGYPEDIVALETAVEHIKQTYGAMNSEDIASFEILQDRYDKCLEDCEKLLESYETEEE